MRRDHASNFEGEHGVIESRSSCRCWRPTSGAHVVKDVWESSSPRANGPHYHGESPSLNQAGEVEWEADRWYRSEHHALRSGSSGVAVLVEWSVIRTQVEVRMGGGRECVTRRTHWLSAELRWLLRAMMRWRARRISDVPRQVVKEVLVVIACHMSHCMTWAPERHRESGWPNPLSD